MFIFAIYDAKYNLTHCANYINNFFLLILWSNSQWRLNTVYKVCKSSDDKRFMKILKFFSSSVWFLQSLRSEIRKEDARICLTYWYEERLFSKDTTILMLD